MRLERKIADKTYFLELKDAWTQRDLREWVRAGSLDGLDYGDMDAVEAAEDRASGAKLALLRKWCSACYLMDEDGHEYRDISEVTPQALAVMDAPLYQMVHVAASEAFARKASLGEARGARS